jgi:exopolysaccharide production protein ExoQ
MDGPPQVSAAPGNAEKAFVVFVLLLSLGVFQNLSITGPIVEQNMGSLGMQILWSFVYLVTLALYFRNCESPLRTLFSVFPVIAVVSYALASVFWSQDPQLSLRRSIALSLTLVFGVYFASRFHPREQFRLLAWSFAFCIIFSFLFELLGLNPSQGYPGWYGVFDIKNQLGQNMVISALVFWFWKKLEPEHGALANTGCLASVGLLALSLAMTAVSVFAVLIVLMPYLQWTMRKSVRRVVGGIAFLLGAGTVALQYALTHLEYVTGLLGKDPALSGRLPLWIVSVLMAVRRPWLGYGFSAFWLPDEGYAQRIWHLLGWMPPQAHNGLLELWLELGLVGTVLFLSVFAYYFARALLFLRHNPGPAAAWPIMFLMFLFFTNLTTAFYLVPNGLDFILFVAIAANLYPRDRESPAGGLAAPRVNYA